jgi:hypothetical protein
VCAEKYATRKKVKLTTLGRLVANDSPFFARLQDNSKNFTVRKYDEVIGWFSSNWPADLAWPTSVPHPNAPNNASFCNTERHARVSSSHPIPDTEVSQQFDARSERSAVAPARGGVSSSSSDRPQSTPANAGSVS